MKRIFFAVWPPAQTAAALAQWAGEAQRQTGGRCVPAERIHLTLGFLGNADEARAIEAGSAAAAPAHELPMEQARYWRENQIVWAGPRETPPALKALVERLELELYRREFIMERRPFAAHVTLIRKARRAPALPPLPALKWPVDEFLLVQSRLSGEGPTYTPVERFALSR
ncbi:MAG: RNA 2',3'-cyclic phosphodiesterase [Betaproteobacteria bacterium]